jgi:hypothetical protein
MEGPSYTQVVTGDGSNAEMSPLDPPFTETRASIDDI